MAGQTALTVSTDDYEAIAAAVMETERGRWFLQEFAKRNRVADTQVLLEAIHRLEEAVAQQKAATPDPSSDTNSQTIERIRLDLSEMAKTIAQTKRDIASINSGEEPSNRLLEASEVLDAIIRTTERATSDILGAAENMQEAAWTLREEGANEALCTALDRHATDIYTACSFHDLTAQRTAKIIHTLRYLENRLHGMIAMWDEEGGGQATSAAQVLALHDSVGGSNLNQSDVDGVILEEDEAILDDELFAHEAESAAGTPAFATDEITLVIEDERVPDAPELAFVSEMIQAETLTPEQGQPTFDDAKDLGSDVLKVEMDNDFYTPQFESLSDLDALDTQEKLRRFS
jgi:hypothetical protein